VRVLWLRPGSERGLCAVIQATQWRGAGLAATGMVSDDGGALLAAATSLLPAAWRKTEHSRGSSKPAPKRAARGASGQRRRRPDSIVRSTLRRTRPSSTGRSRLWFRGGRRVDNPALQAGATATETNAGQCHAN
jgi:hypothetical protein